MGSESKLKIVINHSHNKELVVSMDAVKKIRIIPQRKLRATYSQRGLVYMQLGVEYVRNVSSKLKAGINSIKINSLAVPSEGCTIEASQSLIVF